jgi:hypothetical protein
MQQPADTTLFSTFTIVSLFITVLVVAVGASWWAGAATQPILDGFQVTGPNVRRVAAHEGFAGPAKGAGAPDCLTTSSDCGQLYELLSSKHSTTEEGPEDLRELKLILSKISCLKRDLMGNAKVVQATIYQPFSTSHDLEPVAETAARCFSKTIPQRDLMLSLDKWGSRGTFLIKRLCTSYRLSDGEEEKALTLFGQAMADLGDIALGECCSSSEAVIGGVPQKRMVEGATPVALNALRPYEGYY